MSTVWSVESALRSLRPQKSTGGDGIAAVFLKPVADILAPSLSVIFNRSLSESSVPSDWKDAIVSPVPKIQCPTLPVHYRPIAILPIISKVMERHVLRLLLPAVSPHFPDFQFGFRRGRSTVDCLATVTHEIASLVDRHGVVSCVFFDVKKAFDSCVHAVLLQKLVIDFALPHSLVNWLRSYLTQRTYRVSANGQFSSRSKVVSGVPQGSVLGPILFLCYVNCMKDVKLSELCKLWMFADDLFLCKPTPTDHHLAEFQSDIDSVCTGVETDHLSFQPPKSNLWPVHTLIEKLSFRET